MYYSVGKVHEAREVRRERKGREGNGVDEPWGRKQNGRVEKGGSWDGRSEETKRWERRGREEGGRAKEAGRGTERRER